MTPESGIPPEALAEMQKEYRVSPEIKSLYRGVWAEKLEDGQELPVGGSIFRTELTTKLRLDFASFDEETATFTPENLRALYDQNSDKVVAWLEQIGTDVDPYTYFTCLQVQQKVDRLLRVTTADGDSSFERQKLYAGGKTPALSELRGKTECAERAALGQYLLQKVGIESAYVSGVEMRNATDVDEVPGNHSYLVIKHPKRQDASLVFDIARPYSDKKVPSVLETDVPLTYDLLRDKDDIMVGATEVLQKKMKLWFGVGDIREGSKNIAQR